MADTFSKEKRSDIMARVRSKDTTPELTTRKFLFSRGFRYRVHDKSLPGSPDIVLARYKTVVLVHGCFWHRHEGCSKSRPSSRTEYWEAKFERNKQRDIKNVTDLKNMGWRVIVIYECDLTKAKREERFNRLVSEILSGQIE